MNNDVSSDTMLLPVQGCIYARVCKIDLIDEPLSIFDEAKRTAKWHEFGFRIRCLSYTFDGNIANRRLSGGHDIDDIWLSKETPISAVRFKPL